MQNSASNCHHSTRRRGVSAITLAAFGGFLAVGPSAADRPPAEQVGVRAGAHGTFERIVFQWSQVVGYHITRQGDEIVIKFDRPGRFDFSPVPEELGSLVFGARADGDDVSQRVVVSIRPEAEYRWFDLDDNLVAIDVLKALPVPALKPAVEGIDGAARADVTAVEPAAQNTRGVAAVEGATVTETDAQSGEPSLPDLTTADGTKAAPRQPARATLEATPTHAVDKLRQELRAFGQLIGQLAQRMDRFERRIALGSTDLDSIVGGASGSATAVERALRLPPAATPEPPIAQKQAEDTGGEKAQIAPGEFDVDEEAIDRALERTLVQAGALLLPFGQYEMTPHFSYTRRERDTPIIFVDGQPSFAAEGKVRRNEFLAGQSVRVGLPLDSQLEFDFPYRYVDQSTVTSVNGRRIEDGGSGSGMGDISVGVAKTLLREGSWWPDLVGRFRWNSDSGETEDNDIALGGGFNEISGSFSATKRQDPLAFVGSVSYETTFEKNDVEPGDEIGVSFGTVLAASPETSLRLALAQSFINETKINGDAIDGSDRVASSLTIGASSILGRGVLLDAAVDVGLTDDAPDYAARISVPVRFNVPTSF